MKVKGSVSKVFTRERNGKTFYSVCIAGAADDGSDLWASCGVAKPKVAEGDVIEADIQKDKKWWKVDAADIKIVAQPKAPAGGGGSAGGWNDPNRQKSIVAQSSLKMAMDFVKLAMDSGGLVLGTAKAKAPDIFEALEAAIKVKANEFYNISLNPDAFFEEVSDEEDDEDGDDDDFNPIPD